MVLTMQRPVQSPYGKAATAAGPDRRRRNMVVVTGSVIVIAIMSALTYYSVPLYRLFCQATGFGGTTQVARSAPGGVPGPPITVRFDANVASNLPWRFSAPEPVEVHLGEQHQVSPPTIGKYFYKIQCFCFTEQLLMPSERKEFPVLFYVDPAIADDPEEHDLKTITLSYTFYNKGHDALEKYLSAHPAARGPDGS